MQLSLVATAGGVAASYTDPTQLIFAATALGLGWKRRSLLYLAALAIFYSSFKLSVLYGWWTEGGGIGVPWQQMFAWMAWVDAAFLSLNYGIGRLVRRVFDALRPTESRT